MFSVKEADSLQYELGMSRRDTNFTPWTCWMSKHCQVRIGEARTRRVPDLIIIPEVYFQANIGRGRGLDICHHCRHP